MSPGLGRRGAGPRVALRDLRPGGGDGPAALRQVREQLHRGLPGLRPRPPGQHGDQGHPRHRGRGLQVQGPHRAEAGAAKFDELLHLASRGQHANVDMLVQDIYGGAHQTLGLSGNLIASSFGKSATTVRLCPAPEFSPEDMAKSLLHMISNDIGQLACLYARLHGLDRVYFGGFFIRGHPGRSLSFWRKPEGPRAGARLAGPSPAHLGPQVPSQQTRT
ncbi:Pantothenate kinase 4 [Myotis davidii]|uniref:Pantothenate kinase 4 n=1 Tax=Myotis davidii TaxID=225400 RepID=L5LNV0_MYODS|nr:Pantothenate kinase 4 [Myotis davidii]